MFGFVWAVILAVALYFLVHGRGYSTTSSLICAVIGGILIFVISLLIERVGEEEEEEPPLSAELEALVRLRRELDEYKTETNDRFVFLGKERIMVAGETVTYEDIVRKVVEQLTPKLREHVISAFTEMDPDTLLYNIDEDVLLEAIAKTVSGTVMEKLTTEAVASKVAFQLIEDDLIDLNNVEELIAENLNERMALTLEKSES